MREEIEKILEDFNSMEIEPNEAIDKLLNLHSVMLSETLKQAEQKADKIDEIQDPSGMEAVGFSNGADWVIERIKEKLHSA